jgi:hypothetical protein
MNRDILGQLARPRYELASTAQRRQSKDNRLKTAARSAFIMRRHEGEALLRAFFVACPQLSERYVAGNGLMARLSPRERIVPEESTQIVPVTLQNGTIIRVEARDLGGGGKVSAFDSKAFKDLTDAIEAIAATFRESLGRIKPQKASVAFGVEVGLESGKLTALICKGSGKANVTVTLEWSAIPG